MSILNDKIFPINKTMIAQPSPECVNVGRHRSGRASHQISYFADFLLLLRFSGKAKRKQQSAHSQTDDDVLEPNLCHLITRSALASTFGGIVSPICLAVFRLIASSTFLGSSASRPKIVPSSNACRCNLNNRRFCICFACHRTVGAA